MFYRIGFFCLFCFSLFSAEHVYLKAPRISREEMIGTTVGIRPYRKTGVRLEAEWLQDKLIIHNYGYGGSGLTLAFGGANEVVEILNNHKISSNIVAILGAGVVGLATAYDLLEKGYEVHLYADQWSPHLTSNVAAGSWTPLSFPKDIPFEKKQLHQRMLKTAEQRFLRSISHDPEFDGVSLIYCYKLTMNNAQEAIKATNQEEEVIVHLDNGVTKNARRAYKLRIDGQLFMEDLYSKVKSKGALLQQKRFENLEEILNLEEPVIINCMSMGSREIFDDQEFIPVRGQMIYFAPQDIDYVIFQTFSDSNYFFFLYPWSDRLILGGVNEYGEEELMTNSKVLDEIIQIAEKCLSEN